MSNKNEELDKKPDKSRPKKPNAFFTAFQRIARWFREMRSELKKVVWPTPQQTINNTGIVIVTIFIAGAFIWLFDWIAGSAVSALISTFK